MRRPVLSGLSFDGVVGAAGHDCVFTISRDDDVVA